MKGDDHYGIIDDFDTHSIAVDSTCCGRRKRRRSSIYRYLW